MAVTPRLDDATTARIMLVVLSILWGVTWPIMKLALNEIPPLSMRMGTAFFGAAVLFAFGLWQRRTLTLPTGMARVHVVIASVLNIVAFSLFSAFAQVHASTSRVAFLAYTMPIWSCLLARIVLGERMTRNREIALALCAVGLAVLVYPLAEHGVPGGIVLATAAGASWAAGTIYMKWAGIGGNPIGMTAWMVFIGFLIMSGCTFVFEGTPQLWPVSAWALFGVVFTGAIGSGFAYLLWFEIVQRLPATTASLGILATPVIGVLSSMAILGERPTLADTIGFALIFAAAAFVVIQPHQAARAP